MRKVCGQQGPSAIPLTASGRRFTAFFTWPRRDRIRSRYGDAVCWVQRETLAMDRVNLAHHRIVQRKSKCASHAIGGHAPRVDSAVRDLTVFLARLGPGYSAGAGVRPALPSYTIKTDLHMGCSFFHVDSNRVGVGRVGGLAPGVIESAGPEFRARPLRSFVA